MEELPQWKHELPGIPHKLLDSPLGVAVEFYKEHIKRDVDAGRLKPPEYWIMIRGFLTAAMQTYASICLLLGDKRPKPMMLQANVLNRALFEIFATVLALTEDPEQRTQVLAREGYKQHLARLTHHSARFGNDPKWTEYLDVCRKGLAIIAKVMKLSAEEAKNPNVIKDKWPTLGTMVYGNRRHKIPPFVSGSRLAVLKEVYEFHYPQQSAQAHARAASLAVAMLVDDPSQQWNPGYGESHIVTTALLFLASILMEVESAGDYTVHPKLLELWTYLREIDGEARELWELRYASLSGGKRDV